MGTRGYFAFLYKGRIYYFYNHFDSYISGLGTKLLQELIENDEDWKKLFVSCIIIENEEQYNRMIQFNPSIKESIVTHFNSEYSKLFPNTPIQDLTYMNMLSLYDRCMSMKKVLTSGYLMITEDMDFMYEAEYGYILDFDKERFQVIIHGYNCTLDFSLHQLPKELPEIKFENDED